MQQSRRLYHRGRGDFTTAWDKGQREQLLFITAGNEFRPWHMLGTSSLLRKVEVEKKTEGAVRIFHCDKFTFPLPAGHRFPLQKHVLLREAVATARLVSPEDLVVPDPASDRQILRAHDRDYLRRVQQGELSPKEIRRIGLPWSPELVERARRSVGGTIEACRAAKTDGIAVNLSGGTHHAFRDHGQGYCLFNDIVIAARELQSEGVAARVVVLDCDVHQGNGTAALARDDPSIFTFSIHSESNFPLHKVPSDLDIGLADGTRDADYLEALEAGVCRALELADADLAVYLAGADPHKDDLLGHLALSKDGLAERDYLVLDLCLGAGLPVATVMGGGYGRRVRDTVDVHLKTVRIAAEMAQVWPTRAATLAQGESPRAGAWRATISGEES
jgi:acetoin utilization deacetylase AcuC-like enzyme